MQLTDYEEKSLFAFEKSVIEGKWSNEGLVSLLKLITDDYLQLKKVVNYSKNNNITPQGARKFRDVIKIDNFSFISDNE
jgi:hypothetical protein